MSRWNIKHWMNFTSILIYGIYQCTWDQFASMHGKTPDSYSLRKILMVWRYSQIFYPEQIFPLHSQVCARTIICWCIQVNGLPLHFGETTLVHWHYCLKTIRLWCHTILIGAISVWWLHTNGQTLAYQTIRLCSDHLSLESLHVYLDIASEV